jgi:probable HAF family extracellular repeat protein
MKKNIRPTAIVMLALATLMIPVHLAAQEQKKYHHHYKLVDLGTLGGPASITCVSCFDGQFFASGIVNQQGTAVGFADTSTPDPSFPASCFFDCFVDHAFQWRKGTLTDLGALTSDSSSATSWISPNGLIAGISENGQPDPLFAGVPQRHAVLWQEGKISDLGALEGGYESYASAVNSGGQVVGAALNTIPEGNSMQPGTFWFSTLPGPNQFQVRAFLWDKQNGMQDLGTLPGGTNAQAVFVNELGQVAGFSYTSSASSAFCLQKYGFALTTGSFIWDKYNGMKDLGSLGGVCSLAFGLNNLGQVTGVSSLADDPNAKYHAFLWYRGKLEDLETLGGDTSAPGFISDTGDVVGTADVPCPSPENPGLQCPLHHAILWRNGTKIDLGVLTNEGDFCSRAYMINLRGQIVGNSEGIFMGQNLCNMSGEHAFLWEDGGPMVDLNSLIPAGSSLELSHALAINNSGEIVGLGVPPGCTPDQDEVCGHPYVLIPCDENHPSIEGCDYSLVDSATAAEFHRAPTSDASAAAVSHITLTPSEMTPRFRSSLAGRNRRYGTPQPSPQ